MQSQQCCMLTTRNTPATIMESAESVADSADHDGVLATKTSIANRRWQGIDDSGAVSTGNGGSAANDTSVLAQKLNIANRRWENKDGSASAHQESLTIASSGGSACVGPALGPINSSTGVPENKLAVLRNRETKKEQQAQRRNVDDPANTENSNKNNNSGSTQVELFDVQRQEPAGHQPQGQPTDSTRSTCDAGTNETPEQQREVGEQQEVAFDAYVVDEEEEAEYRQQREQELRQEMERQAFHELVRTLPHAQEVDQEELRQQRKQAERAAARQRRKRLGRNIAAAVTGVAAIIVACVVAIKLSKHENKVTSREDQMAWILEKVSGDAIHDKSTPQYDAFRWLIDEDPMQLSVDGEGVKSFTIAERYVIVLFFFVTGGLSNWTDTLGFLSNSSVCDWKNVTVQKGIGCHDSGSVRVLRIVDNNLFGTLPDELSTLEELEKVILDNNKLFGTIPNSLDKNTMLERITLGENLLSGTIPDLSSLDNFQTLELFVNFLTGTLPGWVTSSSELEFLNVWNNFLSGPIPPFASQDGLQFVDLGANLFDGSIPHSLGALSVLESLCLENNLLAGSISTLMGQVTKLHQLFLYSKGLTGTIPTEIGYLRHLQEIALDDNGLTGPIPTELGGLTDLVVIYLNNNLLTGTVPTQLAQLKELQYLYLHQNSLIGDVSEICFNQGNQHQNNGFEQLVAFYTDCEGAFGLEVDCPCCTHCCDDMTGSCSPGKTPEEKCREKALQWEEFTENGSGSSVCECSEGGQTVACQDSDCMYCDDADGTVCYVDAGHGIELGLDDTYFLAVSIQYVHGRDEHVFLQDQLVDGKMQCTSAINGKDCVSCYHVKCEDGYDTDAVDCSNLGYGYLSACTPFDDPFIMLWDIANSLYVNKEFPVRHDCVRYNTSEVVGLQGGI